jgi:hypothetical protein
MPVPVCASGDHGDMTDQVDIEVATREDLAEIVAIRNAVAATSIASFDTRPTTVADQLPWFDRTVSTDPYRILVARRCRRRDKVRRLYPTAASPFAVRSASFVSTRAAPGRPGPHGRDRRSVLGQRGVPPAVGTTHRGQENGTHLSDEPDQLLIVHTAEPGSAAEDRRGELIGISWSGVPGPGVAAGR